MQPARLDLRINQGATLRKPLLMMQPGYVYKPITAIQATAPLLLTVPGHGLFNSWLIWIEGVSAWGDLARDKSKQHGYMAKVLDENTLELNSINGLGRSASGGVIVYQPPVDLTDCTARMFIRDSSGSYELELTTENGRLLIGVHGRLIVTLTPEEAADITWQKGRYDLKVTMSNGDVNRWAEGEVRVSQDLELCNE